MKTLRIAQAQMPVLSDTNVCVSYVQKAAETAASQGAVLLALPEMFCCPYDVKCFPVYAEEEGGAIWQACSHIAEKNRLFLSAGTMPEKDRDGHIFNTAYVFDPSGRQIAKHRKVHLFDIDVEGGQHFHESDVLTAGNHVTTFQIDSIVFGLAVCYDIRFPEFFRLMARKGARAVLVPAAFNMTTGPKHWDLLFRSQALNNQLFTIGTAPARDLSSSYISWGHSIVAGPWGEVVTELDEKESLKITELDFDETEEIRRQIPVLEHLREDVYRLSECRP